MTPIQFDILDKLYFVENYHSLLSEINVPENILKNELKDMIKLGWVQIMKFDEKSQDFLPTPFLNVDDLPSCFFLATKKGLLQLHLK
jgi:hypothetical protein